MPFLPTLLLALLLSPMRSLPPLRSLPTLLLPLLLVLCATTTTHAMQQHWRHWGGDLANRRFANISCLDTGNLKNMKTKWVTNTTGINFATPTVCDDSVYTVCTRGFVYRYNASTGGRPVWNVSLNTLGIPVKKPTQFGFVWSRTSPILSDDCQRAYVGTMDASGSWLIAITTATGAVAFAKKIDPQEWSMLTMSGVFYKGDVYVGTASSVESHINTSDFRGSMLRVNGTTGNTIWQAFTCPPGWQGCAIWGSSPVIDEARQQICVGTGNNYKIPDSNMRCREAAGRDLTAQTRCDRTNNLVIAMACFDLRNGSTKWSRKLHGLDVWLPQNRNYGDDYDFGQGLVLVNTSGGRSLMIGTPKSGRTVAVHAANGSIAWGPTSAESGGFVQYGSCSNGAVYCVGYFWYGSRRGVVRCFNTADGKVRWRRQRTTGLGVFGPLTCTQNTVFAPFMDGDGSVVAYNIDSGKQRARFQTKVTMFCGPSIVKGVMYFGSGYWKNGGRPDRRLWAVNLPLRGTC